MEIRFRYRRGHYAIKKITLDRHKCIGKRKESEETD